MKRKRSAPDLTGKGQVEPSPASDDDGLEDERLPSLSRSPAPFIAEELEKEEVLDEARTKREREWQKEKRRKIREEETVRRERDARNAKDHRRAQKVGQSMMTAEERTRYAEVVSVGGTTAGAGGPKAAAGLRGRGAGRGGGAEDDDAGLFGGFQSAAPRRRNFLHGSAAAGA